MKRRELLVGSAALALFPFSAMASEDTVIRLKAITKLILNRVKEGQELSEMKSLFDALLDKEYIAKKAAGREKWQNAIDKTRKEFADLVIENAFEKYVGRLKNYGVDKALKHIDELKFREQKKGKWVFYKTVLFIERDINIKVKTHEEKIRDVLVVGFSLVDAIGQDYQHDNETTLHQYVNASKQNFG